MVNPGILVIDTETDSLLRFKELIADAFTEARLFSASYDDRVETFCLVNHPDLIFLKVSSPEDTAFRICQSLKANPLLKSIPVVLLTDSEPGNESRIKALRYKADAMLSTILSVAEIKEVGECLLNLNVSENKPVDESEQLIKLLEDRTNELKACREKILDQEQRVESESLKCKQIEEELKICIERFSQVANSSELCVWEVDATGRYTYCSESFSNIFGYTPDEIIGKKYFYDFFPSNVKEEFTKKAFELFQEKKACVAFENPIVKHDGTQIIVETNGFPILDQEGNLAGYRGIDKDVTDRKQHEKALQQSEEIFRTLANSTATIIFIYQDDKFLYCNKAFEELSGYTSDEILTLCLWDIVHPDSRELVKSRGLARLKGRDVLQRYEFKIIAKDGTVIWLDYSAGNISWKGVSAIIGSALDITERKQVEELFRKEKRLLEGVIKGTNAGTWSFNPFTGEDIHNERWAEIIGYSLNELEGNSLLTWENSLHPDDLPHALAELEKLTSGEIDYYDVVFRQKHKNGDWIWINSRGAVIERTEKGEPRWISGTHIDITERKRAEELIRENEQLFQTLFNSSPDAMLLIDPEDPDVPWRIVDCNSVACTMNGYSREEMIGSSIDLVNAKEGSESERIGYVSQLKEKKVLHDEYLHRHKDGHIFPVENSTSLVTIGGKEFILGIDRDITDRKHAEAALLESENRYKSFISQVSEGVYRFEFDQPMDIQLPVEEQIDYIIEHSYIAECNESYLKMYGNTSPSEIIGKYAFGMHVSRENSLNRSSIRRFIENGYKARNHITEEKHNKGHLMLISNNATGIIENNQLIRMWGTQTEITDKVRAEKIQQVLYEISNAALISDDLEEFINTIGVEIDQLLKTSNFFIALYDDQSQSLTSLYEKVKSESIFTWPVEDSLTGLVIKTKKSLNINKSSFEVLQGKKKLKSWGRMAESWLGIPLLLNDKAIGAVVAQNYDLPDAFSELDKQMLEIVANQLSFAIGRKKAEKEIVEAMHRAKESDRLKSAFLANMSHEIRTPLNSIIGFSDLLLDPEFGAEHLLEFAQNINSSGNNLLAVINDIMDISMIEAGQVILRKAEFPIGKLLKEIQDEFVFRATTKGIELRYNVIESDDAVTIVSDRNKLKQVLINFVSNAIKFTEKGYIELGVIHDSDRLKVYVKDTGIGIPEIYHHSVFERFRQIESSETRKYGGNGLGLAISKSLIEMLGGEIGMESVPGKGSTFYFVFQDTNS